MRKSSMLVVVAVLALALLLGCQRATSDSGSGTPRGTSQSEASAPTPSEPSPAEPPAADISPADLAALTAVDKNLDATGPGIGELLKPSDFEELLGVDDVFFGCPS